jgi:hypothetical protein
MQIAKASQATVRQAHWVPPRQLQLSECRPPTRSERLCAQQLLLSLDVVHTPRLGVDREPQRQAQHRLAVAGARVPAVQLAWVGGGKGGVGGSAQLARCWAQSAGATARRRHAC